MLKLDLEKAEEPEIKLPTFIGSSRKQVFQKNIYFCIIDYAKAFDCVDHNRLWKILQELWVPSHVTCLLKNLYAGQEATVRTGHGITDWFQIGKGVSQGCILSPCLLNLYAEYIMGNAGLDEAQAGINIAGRNINNLRYADDTKWSEVAQSCPILCDPIDYSLQGSSVHGIFQARVLEWVAISFSRGSSWPRDWTQVSHITGRHFT